MSSRRNNHLRHPWSDNWVIGELVNSARTAEWARVGLRWSTAWSTGPTATPPASVPLPPPPVGVEVTGLKVFHEHLLTKDCLTVPNSVNSSPAVCPLQRR
jgi:hypothetical protein